MKTLVVTGASRGIGRATAVAAGRNGWRIGVNYRKDANAANAVVSQVLHEGGDAIAIEGDVTSEVDVIRIFDRVTDHWGRIDGVVVNAGIAVPSAMLADMEIQRFRSIVDVNVIGALLCCREAAKRLPITRGGAGGTIVIVSSAAARNGAAGMMSDYACTKGALDSLTISLSKELASDGVRVNAVRPGIIDTDIHALAGREDRSLTARSSVPLGRAGRAEEVAEAILWLSGDASSYVTGALIDVAGGN